MSVVDAGGGGSLAYNPATGVITFNGPANADIRAALSATTPVMFDSAGVISVNFATTSLRGIASFNTNNFLVTSGAVAIKTAGVDSAAIAANSITSAKLAANSVGFAAMADSAVGSDELRQAVQLIIYNSAGTPVKTLFGAGV
jgi:hypothetical protein